MDRSITIGKLVADHRSLRSHGEALIALASSLRPADMMKLQDLRWTLTREAHQHLVIDERYVHVPLENHPTSAVREKAAELRDDAEQFRAYWTSHIAEWSIEKVQANWRGYGISVRDLISRMHSRLDREENELYPLLGSGDLTDTGEKGHNWAGEALRLRTSLYSTSTIR